ncbi:oligosaccharide flippase family protein (plasmid) [Sphingomonadaceae bacterium OTU29THOMA1]|nr:oligosaccharide flippase family protein [Sphingomonadaceae bacterium OTU29THOMA1]
MSFRSKFDLIGQSLDITVLKQSALYIASLGLGKITQLLSIFVYSYFLSTSDFGFYSVFTSYIWILAIAVSGNSHLAIGRYLYEDEIDNTVMMSTVLSWIGVITIIYSLAFLLLTRFVDVGWTPLVWVCLLVVGLGFVADSILTQISAFAQDARLLLIPSALRAVISSGVTLTILYISAKPDATALILGDAIGTVPVLIYIFRTPIRLKLTGSVAYLRRMFSYALPLTPYMLALTLLSQFDRILIAAFLNERAAGLYALSYNFGVLPLLASTAVTSALTKSFFDDLKAGRNAALVAQADYAFGLSALCFGLVMALGESVAWLVLPDRYAEAFRIIPVVAYAGMIFTMFQIWVRVLAFRDRPALISGIAILGVGTNVGLNILLIPIWGFPVAAWTTAIAYAIMTFLVIAVVRGQEKIADLPAARLVTTLSFGALPLILNGLLDVGAHVRQGVLIAWFCLFTFVVLRPIFRPLTRTVA